MLDSMRKQNFGTCYVDGLVVNNLDPAKARRVQVRVAGVHDDVPDADLPWAACGVFAGRGPLANAGHVAIPAIGSLVLVEFQQGDPQNPMYVGSVSAQGTVPDLFKVNYPTRSGWLLQNNSYFYVDETTHDAFLHHRGTTLNIKASGATYGHVAAELNVNVVGATTLTTPSLLVDCPETTFTGNVTIQQHLTVNSGISGIGDVVFDGYSLKGHHHIEQGDGAPTSAAQP